MNPSLSSRPNQAAERNFFSCLGICIYSRAAMVCKAFAVCSLVKAILLLLPTRQIEDGGIGGNLFGKPTGVRGVRILSRSAGLSRTRLLGKLSFNRGCVGYEPD